MLSNITKTIKPVSDATEVLTYVSQLKRNNSRITY